MTLAPSAFVADSTLLHALEQRAEPVDCIQDRVLFRQGDLPVGVYILRRGAATLTLKSAAGGEVMRIEAAAGSVLGLPGLIGNEPYSLTAVAQSGSEVGFVALEDFSALLLAEPQMSFRVLEVLAAEVRTARQAAFEV